MRNRRNVRKNSKIGEILSGKSFEMMAIILLIVILLSAALLFFRYSNDKKQLALQREEIEKQTEEIYKALEEPQVTTNVPVETTTVAKICVVGDILCGTEMLEDAKQGDKYQFDNMFSNISHFIKNSNLAIGTLETNFTSNEYSGLGKYNSPVEFLNSIKNSGIGVVSLAHNHVLDYGETGMKETISKIKEKDMDIIGISNNENSENKEFTGIIKEVKRINIAVLAYTYGLSNSSNLSEEEKALVSIYDKDKVKQDMDYAKENSDFIIVIMHWGDVNKSTISNWQREVKDYLVENGADMILGSHPSVVEPMEMVKTEDGKNVLVAYSLGNYISSFNYDNADVELILNIEIQKEAKEKKAMLKKVDYTPIYVLDNGTRAENRFELVDMKQVAIDYTNGDTETITKAAYNKIIKKLEWLNNLIVKTE